MQYIWDILILGILIGLFIWGYYKGLIKTIFGLAAIVIAVFGAITFKAPVGEWIDDAFVHQPVRKYVLGVISDAPVLSYDDALAKTDIVANIKKMPAELKGVLNMAGIDPEQMITEASSGLQKSSNEFKNKLVDRIADPISATISTAIAVLVLFVVLLALCLIAAKLLGALCSLIPLGKKLDKLGGGILGLIKAAVVILVISAVIWGISAGTKDDSVFSRDTIEKTVVLKEIIHINPICKLL